jgi:hypothetical protein
MPQRRDPMRNAEHLSPTPYPYEDILVPWILCALFLVSMQCFLALFEMACDIMEDQRRVMTYTDLPRETVEASTQTRPTSQARRRVSFT